MQLCRICGHPEDDHIDEFDLDGRRELYYCIACMNPKEGPLYDRRYHEFKPPFLEERVLATKKDFCGLFVD